MPAHPHDCSEIKRRNPYARSGPYTISITGDGKSPPISVYCDMSGKIGWTKVLQIARPYSPNTGAIGNVAIGSTFTESGKLSDKTINTIADNMQPASGGNVIYRLTASDTTDKVFVHNPKAFHDTSVAWGIFTSSRRQCFNPDIDRCTWFSTNYYTLDTLHDGSGSGQGRRFFTEYRRSTSSRCFNPESPNRCVNAGITCDHCMRQKVQLWIGY